MKRNYKKIIIVFLIFFLLIIFFILKNKREENNFSFALVDNVKINLEIADNDEERYLGLSFRQSIPEYSGMLFLFPEKGIRSFVMRDMNFPLDIVFIEENKIIDIYSNLPFDVDSSKVLYNSSLPVDKVLELNGGFCQQHNISVGDEIKFF